MIKETKPFSNELKDWIIKAVPDDTALHGEKPELRHTYLPATHIKALRPDTMLVVGIRGAGKSFWWSALQQKELRNAIGLQTGITKETMISRGFGATPAPLDYPGKDVISDLVNTHHFDPRKIWQTIVLKHVSHDWLPPEFSNLTSWKDRVVWVIENSEIMEHCLYEADKALEHRNIHHLVLFDALDRTADDWKTMHSLVRGLLQVVLDFRSFRRIRLKAFVRPDQIEDPMVTSFPDSSKVLNQKVDLNWPRNELYGLFWHYLANEPQHGTHFRDECERITSVGWNESGGVWSVPEALRNDEEKQRLLFHAMTGPWMGRDIRRGFPYTWLTNHLGDARKQVSPRSFLAALRHTAQSLRSDHDYPLHYESIKQGVQEASKIRVAEIQEDYPWVRNFMEPLKGFSVPCLFDDIKKAWDKDNVIVLLNPIIWFSDALRLPPTHIEDGPEGVMNDLIDLGLFERISGERINLPDVYRLGYGIGRRGGVKPIK